MNFSIIFPLVFNASIVDLLNRNSTDKQPFKISITINTTSSLSCIKNSRVVLDFTQLCLSNTYYKYYNLSNRVEVIWDRVKHNSEETGCLNMNNILTASLNQSLISNTSFLTSTRNQELPIPYKKIHYGMIALIFFIGGILFKTDIFIFYVWERIKKIRSFNRFLYTAENQTEVIS